jgi:hypothetical protein
VKVLAGAGAAAVLAVACAAASGGSAAGPDFKLVNAHWLLCPAGATDLTMCCPQPADPRRCVIPGVAPKPAGAPTALTAFARFKNLGTSGRATATFSTPGPGYSRCSVALPFTSTGGSVAAWCSLGSGVEGGSEPQVSIVNARPAGSSP